MYRAALPVAILLLSLGQMLHAQQGAVCDLDYTRTGAQANFINQGQDVTATFPRFVCDGGRMVITADQANFFKATGRIDLFRNVNVRDSAHTLTADQAVFFVRRRDLQATGNAVLTDRITGSVIRGDLVNYQEKTAQRESRIEAVATTGNAQAVIVRDSAGVRDTTTVDANHIIITGEESFSAVGNARMRRDSLNITAHTIQYAQSARTMEIAGGGSRVTLPRYTLTGDSISARTNATDEIESVLSRHNTRLESEEMNVRAGALWLAFAGDNIERMVAMKWPAVAGYPEAPRARVEAPEFHMEADSIDVLAPGQQIREAVAIGKAYGERVTPDSLKQYLPEVSPEAAALIANDWMRGDTVRAFFAANPKAVTDPAASDRIMERLLASGSPAQSMYRMRDEENPTVKLSINYLVASQIEVTFNDGAAALLRASGDAKGVYLQPEEAARRTRVGGTTPGGVLRP